MLESDVFVQVLRLLVELHKIIFLEFHVNSFIFISSQITAVSVINLINAGTILRFGKH